MTYAEKILVPLGYKLVAKTRDPGNPLKVVLKVVLSIGHSKLQFDCVCPQYPSIRALGCPLHHDGPGGSWPISEAERIAKLLLNN